MFGLRARSLTLDPTGITVNGHRLSHYGAFVTGSGVEIGEAQPALTFQDVPGRAGVDTSLRDRNGFAAVGRRDITIGVGLVGRRDEIMEGMAAIGGLNGQRGTLGGVHDKGELRGAWSVDAWDTQYDTAGEIRWATTTLTLDAEPVVYGPARTVTLNAGETRFLVEGNRPAWPVIRLTVPGRRSMAVDAIGWVRAHYERKFTAMGWDSMTDSEVLDDITGPNGDWTQNPEWWVDMGNSGPDAWNAYARIFDYTMPGGDVNIRVYDPEHPSVFVDAIAAIGSDDRDVPVSIDMERRRVEVRDNAASCSLESAWFQLNPGRCALYSNAPGTLTYTPQWLI